MCPAQHLFRKLIDFVFREVSPAR